MMGVQRFSVTRRRVIFGCGGLLALCICLAVGYYVHALEEEKTVVKELVRRLFVSDSIETEAELTRAIATIGAVKPGLLFWGLEANNATFMLPEGRLDDLLDAVVRIQGGAAGIIDGAREVLRSKELAGKLCAIRVLLRYKAPADAELLQVLLNKQEKGFLRQQAVLALGQLANEHCAADIALIIDDEKEPSNLKEACLIALASAAPFALEAKASQLLVAESSTPATVKRSATLLARAGFLMPLRQALIEQDLKSERRAEIAKALVDNGEAQDLQLVQTVTIKSGEPALEAAMLETVIQKKLEGFDSVILNGLRSESKKLRLLAIRAGRSVGSTTEIETEMTRVAQAASPEEAYVLQETSK